MTRLHMTAPCDGAHFRHDAQGCANWAAAQDAREPRAGWQERPGRPGRRLELEAARGDPCPAPHSCFLHIRRPRGLRQGGRRYRWHENLRQERMRRASSPQCRTRRDLACRQGFLPQWSAAFMRQGTDAFVPSRSVGRHFIIASATTWFSEQPFVRRQYSLRDVRSTTFLE